MNAVFLGFVSVCKLTRSVPVGLWRICRKDVGFMSRVDWGGGYSFWEGTYFGEGEGPQELDRCCGLRGWDEGEQTAHGGGGVRGRGKVAAGHSLGFSFLPLSVEADAICDVNL